MSLSSADRPPLPAAPAGRAAAEAVGIAAWLLAAAAWVAWYRYGDRGFGPMHLATAAGLVLTLAYLARRGWVRLFGPVLFYEGLRAARRTRFFVLRWLYAVGLLLLLLWVHWIWGMENRHADLAVEQAYKQQAKLAEEFFYAFAIVQFAVVVLLTPAYVAGAVAEEKERRTLEFLLATDLRGREIVFGKLLARLGNLALFVMTGLPVLSLMQFFGGIDPGLLLASFVVTALTAGSLAGLGILLSVQRRRARDAIILTYLAALGYVAIASLCLAIPPLWAEYHRETMRTVVAANRAAIQPAAAPYYQELESTVKWLNAGNPFYGLWHIVDAINTGGSVANVLQDVIERYALFHGLFTAGCVALAVVRIRPVALAQAGGLPRQKKRRFQLLRFRRPPVGRLPMLWKEVRVEGGLRFGWLGRILVGLVVGVSFVPFVIIVYLLFFDPYLSSINYHRAWDELGKEVNTWLRAVNAIVSSLMLLGVAVRAAGAFGSERDRDTLVSLMTTTLTTTEIFWAKLAGSLLSVRMFLVWLAVVWAIGLLTGAVGILAVPLQVVLWLIPATFMAALGMYCSAVGTTTLRATTWTIVGTLVALGGHWVCLGMCCYAPLTAAATHGDRGLEWLLDLELGLTPPYLFGWLPYRDIADLRVGDGKASALYAAAQVVWIVAAAVIGHLAHEKFRQLTNRQEWAHGQPRSLPPPVKSDS
jgi:ABC-type transport system involved in multi-copper enzyme maturation permease subunit